MSGSPAQPEREGETEKRTAGGIPADDYSRKVKRLLICGRRSLALPSPAKKPSTKCEVVVKVVSAA